MDINSEKSCVDCVHKQNTWEDDVSKCLKIHVWLYPDTYNKALECKYYLEE